MLRWHEATRSRWIARDLAWARALHRLAAQPACLLTLIAASRLGDGPLWYLVIAVLPLVGGPAGAASALQMLGVGLLNLLIYRVLKQRIGRARPYVNCPDIRACTKALDAFSFPSGHTLHAVAFALVLGFHFPASLLLTLPLALAVAASRVVLGLHYPSDVAVGAAIGALTASLVLLVN